MLRPLYMARSSMRGSIPRRAFFYFTVGELPERSIGVVLKTASVLAHAQEFESPTPRPVYLFIA